MGPLTSLISSTNWIFVLVATVISMVIGMFWYGKYMFGPSFAKWMKLPPMLTKGTPEDKDCTPPMGKLMLFEFVSRALYFIGLGRTFTVAPQETMGGMICLAIILWLAFSLSTQISAVIRSPANRNTLWIAGSKMLLDTIIAAILRFMVF